MYKVSSSKFQSSLKLDGKELVGKDPKCAICRSPETRVTLALQEDVSLRKCLACKCKFVDNQPSDSALSEFYTTYYKDNTEALTVDAANKFAKYIVRQYLKNREVSGVATPISILDFGGGDGSMALRIENLLTLNKIIVKEVLLVDKAITTPLPDSAKLRRVADLAVIEEKFDIIIASAVLEHLKEPLPTLLSLIDLLSPSGLMYIRTPHIAPLLKVAGYLRIQVDFGFPAHLFDLGNDFWSWFVTSSKYKEVGVKVLKQGASLVETSFRKSPIRTCLAFFAKLPPIFGFSRWRFSGGWQIILQKYR